jgi:hypothetical protein
MHWTPRSDWLRTLERALSSPEGEGLLVARDLSRAQVMVVAQFDGEHADPGGMTSLTHAETADLLGLPRKTVHQSRLVMIELGYRVILSPGRFGGTPRRRLQFPPH